jgi:hypothetical protein
MDAKYNRVAKFGKPIVIAEFGVSGSDQAKMSYLTGALTEMREYPLLRLVCFFFAKNTPGAWGAGVSTPKWSLGNRYLDPEVVGSTPAGRTSSFINGLQLKHLRPGEFSGVVNRSRLAGVIVINAQAEARNASQNVAIPVSRRGIAAYDLGRGATAYDFRS